MPVVLNVQLIAPDSVPTPDFKFISALAESSKRFPLLVIAPLEIVPAVMFLEESITAVVPILNEPVTISTLPFPLIVSLLFAVLFPAPVLVWKCIEAASFG